MIAIPAVDLRGGACVQLVGGNVAAERVRIADPERVAARWVEAGFRALHVVDLDAALGVGTNRNIITAILRTSTVPVGVGGGVRESDQVTRWLEAGASRIVVGTRAVTDPEWLEREVSCHPGRLVVAADVRGREVVTRGWTAGSGLEVTTLLDRLSSLPLAGVLVTAVHREGRLQGPDLPLIAACAARTPLPVLASGGVSGAADLRALRDAGARAAILGMALYTGALVPDLTAREFASCPP